MDAIKINERLQVPVSELRFSFDRSPGPGGQNVNKVNTRAELRFNVWQSCALDEEQRQRLQSGLRSRLTQEGILIIRSSRFRSQGRNREDCVEKFAALLSDNLRPPPPKRRPTRPGKAAQARRQAQRTHHSQKKARRRKPIEE